MKRISSRNLDPETLTEIRKLHQRHWWQILFILTNTYGQILFFPILYAFYQHWLVVVLGVFVIGARQASIYEINHEASHYKFLNGARANKYFSLLFCVIPFFHHVETFSFVQWRRVHRLHHVYLMTEKDPNFVQRQLTGEADKPFTPLTTLVAALKAIPYSWIGLLTFKQDYVYPDGKTFEKHKYSHWQYLLPIPGDKEMQIELAVRYLFSGLLIYLIIHFSLIEYCLLFWFLPMYTSYPAILKYMDIMDHNWSDRSDSIEENSNSRHRNFLVRFFTSNLHRYYHREHHYYPMVPAANMPKLHQLLKYQVPHESTR